MGESRDIRGIEFDWFAIDLDGQVALFATAGHGPAPTSVMAAPEAHEEIGKTITVSGFGSLAIWKGYAQAGLYAYDWSDLQAGYVRVAEPLSGSTFEQAHLFTDDPGLPRLALSFSQEALVPARWQDGT